MSFGIMALETLPSHVGHCFETQGNLNIGSNRCVPKMSSVSPSRLQNDVVDEYFVLIK